MATPMGNASFAPGQKVGAGRFTLMHDLGLGDMGMIWLAQDEELNKEVALKFLPAEVSDSPEALRSLRNEVAKAQALSHERITATRQVKAANVPKSKAINLILNCTDDVSLNILRYGSAHCHGSGLDQNISAG
ncbi:MAG: hypothetical protein WCO56_23680 [Verrucomicrobiota bacterium]